MKNRSTSPVVLIAGAGTAADLLYRSGFAPVDPIVFIDTGMQRHLVVPLLEAGRAMNETKGVTVHTPQSLRIPRAKRRSSSEWALAVLRRLNARRIAVPPEFPAGALRRLERAGIRVAILDGPVYPQRARKSAEEIEAIATTQRAAVAAMKRAVEVIRAATIGARGILVAQGRPLTSETVRREIDLVLLAHDCQARETIVAGGRQAADPHDRGHGPLRAHETIVIDIFPQHRGTGYWGDITRTVVKGTPSDTAARAHAAVAAAQRTALSMIRAGVRADRVHRAVQASLEAGGFTNGTRDGVPTGFFHGTGHGVGLEIHEAPSLSTVPGRLAAGNVVTVEPGLYDPAWGGIRIEDTVVVTGDGYRILASCRVPFVL